MKKLILLTLIIFFFTLTNAQNWNQIQKIVSSDRDSIDSFGISVSISGNKAIVGAYWESEDTFGSNTMEEAGSAYIFERGLSGNWNQVQKIVASDRDVEDHFGTYVSISGNYAIVGAPWENHDVTGGNNEYKAGSAYIFERDSSGNWNQIQKIVASDRADHDLFGNSVSICDNYVIVGACFEDEDEFGGNTKIWAGSAYIFERNSSGIWSQVKKIVASDRGVDDYFGISVAISGNSIIVGAWNEDEDANGGNNMSVAGSAYIFKRDASGYWNQTQKIVALDRAPGDNFGFSVSIDSNYIIVGAMNEDQNSVGGSTMSSAGSAYIFERNTSGNWNQIQKIVASDRETYDWYGFSVSISGDHVVVGAVFEDNDLIGGNYKSNAGSSYLYKKDSIGNWNQIQKLIALDRNSEDNFGTKVSIDRNYVIIGARYEDEDALGGNTMNDAGSAYIFKTCTNFNSSSIDTLSACYSFTSPSSNYIWTSSGTYMDTIPNSVGCDSIITINLTIYTVDTSVTKSGITLTANSSSANYQWLDCNNGYSIIAGATNQSFTPTANSSYAVEITENGCVDTSACYIINNVGIIENVFEPSLKFYPNPTSRKITVDLGKTYKDVNITVRNTLEQIVLTKNFKTTNLLSFEIEDAKGVYFVEIHTAEGLPAETSVKTGKSAVFKVVKE